MSEPVVQTAESGGDSHAHGPRYQPLVIVLVAVCAGIVVDRFQPIMVQAWWAGALACSGAWWLLWRRGRETAAAVALLVAVAATAASWHHLRWYLFPRDDLGYFATYDAEPICLEAIARRSGEVLPAPERNPMRAIPIGDRTLLDLEPVRVRDGNRWRPVCGRVRLDADGMLRGIRAGDRLRIFAQLSAPSRPHNPGQIDYAGFLRSGGCRARLRTEFPECVSVVQPGWGWRPAEALDRARNRCSAILWRHLDPRRAALASAVLLGVREQLDPEEEQAFLETGTIHLLAVSGLNVGILALVLIYVARRMPVGRGWALAAVAGLTVFYMLLTKAQPPIIRATILVLVMCGSLYLGRKALGFNSLAAAALVVLAVNPADLFGVGAQLSFLAVAGLTWFTPQWVGTASRQDALERLIAESRPWPARMLWATGRSLRHLTLVSTAIWLLTLPLVMARFHLFTPIAMILNTLVWMPMALALWGGFITLLAGLIYPPLGVLPGRFCDFNLWLLQTLVDCGQAVPGSHFWVPGPPEWWVLGFYGGLAVLAAAPRLRPPRRWCLAILALWITAGFAAAALRHPSGQLRTTFLSMGHGCSVVLELPSGQTMLYDAGQFASPGAGAKSIAGFLWSRGLTHVDAVVLSHGDIDHYDALPGLLEQFSVGVIYVSPFMFERPNEALDALRASIERSGVPMRTIRGGDLLPGGPGCRVEVLHPPQAGVLGPDNANSLVLAVEYLGRRILLTGDLDSPGLEDVLAEEPLDCDVLQAPHHGSRASNSPALAAWCKPEWVVVSGSRRWDLAPLRKTYGAVGSTILHTAESGAVEVTIDPAGVAVRPFLQSNDDK